MSGHSQQQRHENVDVKCMHFTTLNCTITCHLLNASIKKWAKSCLRVQHNFSFYFALLVEFTSTPHGRTASVDEVIVRVCVSIAQIARYLTSVVFLRQFFAISLQWILRDSTWVYYCFIIKINISLISSIRKSFNSAIESQYRVLMKTQSPNRHRQWREGQRLRKFAMNSRFWMPQSTRNTQST